MPVAQLCESLAGLVKKIGAMFVGVQRKRYQQPLGPHREDFENLVLRVSEVGETVGDDQLRAERGACRVIAKNRPCPPEASLGIV